MKHKILAFALAISMSIPSTYAQSALVSMDFPAVETNDMAKSISELTGKTFLIESQPP